MSIENLEWSVKALGLEYKKEVLLIKGRKFRADIFIATLNLAIEYEGVFSSKSRHTSLTGYSKDCQKYNLYTINGYRLLRYTAMNQGDIIGDLKEIMQNDKSTKFN